jgi:hypothetical protein
VTTRKLLSLRVQDFSGGLNLRDAPSELGSKFSPDLWNVTLDERGGVGSRLGYGKFNGSSFTATPPQALFNWPTGNALLTQCGANLYANASTTSIHTFTTTDRVGMVEFLGPVYIIHPVDGLFTYNGTTFTLVSAAVKGNTIAAFQNKLWSSGDPANFTRVRFSNAGDPTTWAGFVDIRDKDETAVVCVGPALGTDIVGRAGLTVFKNRSAYRLYDSATGAYQTIDSTRGAASALATTVVNNKILVVNEFGIFATDGVGPLKNVSEQLGPLWDPSEINVSRLSQFCAGTFGQRAYFSLPRAGATANNLMLEYHSEEGWITANSNAASCYAPLASAQQLYMGSPTVNGQVYQMFSTGADDGTAIASYFRTPWFELASGARCRLPNLRVNGRGTFTASMYRDYSLASPITRAVTITPTSGVAAYASDLHSLGVGRAFSLRIDATTSTTFSAPALLGGAQPTVGAVGLYELAFYPIALGLR